MPCWVQAKILYRTRYRSWLKCVASFTHIPSGSRETQLLASVLHTTQRKHALSFVHPLYDCMPPYVWTLPYVYMPPYVFGYPPYIHNTKKACFVRLRGCLYPPYICTLPCMFGQPHMFKCPQMHVGHSNVWGIQRYGGIQSNGGHLNI